MSDVKKLRKAAVSKNDEFYTYIETVEAELTHYTEFFKDKIVYCNCDNPMCSAFWEYFHINFAKLQLKKLIATYYDRTIQTYKFEYIGGADSDITTCERIPLNSHGDFRSPQCVAILKECDVVVTNPPFSLFRSFMTLLHRSGIKFIVLGNMNAALTKDIFPLFAHNLVWYGVSIHAGDVKFRVPNNYPALTSNCGVDDMGKRYICVPSIRWYTNIDHACRHVKLKLSATYTPTKYVKFDNYDAINVNSYRDIPADYVGLMGVPVSFLDYYCPDQFKILNGFSRYAIIDNEYSNPIGTYGSAINGRASYFRILIRKLN